MRRLVAVGLLSALLALVVGGCNIFSFTAPDDSVADNVADGRKALRDGDYELAIEKFTAAIDSDPTNAYARWGIAKAYIRRTGFTSISIMSQVSAYESDGELPFMGLAKPDANSLYQGVISANEHLVEILNGNAENAELNSGSISLDYTGTSLIQGILMFRDTNVDGAIDDNDFDLVAMFSGGQFVLTEDVWDQLTPEEQAALLNNVLDLLDASGAALDTFLTALFSDTTDTVGAGFDTENIGGVIDGIREGVLDYGGGGPALVAPGGASNLRTFSKGGSR